jgi:hypothetical protein
MSQAIHYHDVQWPYGPHGLKPQCNGLPGMWARQAIHYHNFLWPHRTQGLKPQPHKILEVDCLGTWPSMGIGILCG